MYFIGPKVLELYEDAFYLGSLVVDINRGVKKLLPKSGDKSQVKNWIPITHLNLSYKIVHKVLAR